MPLRVNPIILLGLIITLILSIVVFASAQLGGGGSAGAAIAAGEAQVGKPHVEGTDGPNAFSCTGLIRYMLRTAGVDNNAPWSPEGYLGAYPNVPLNDLQPGDVVIYPGWATMYVGNGMLLNSNAALGVVTNTPMSEAGTPEGAARPPYGGSSQPQTGATQPPSGATPGISNVQYRSNPTQLNSGAPAGTDATGSNGAPAVTNATGMNGTPAGSLDGTGQIGGTTPAGSFDGTGQIGGTTPAGSFDSTGQIGGAGQIGAVPTQS